MHAHGTVSYTHLDVYKRQAINRLKFNYYEIDDSLDVYVTFETMNNRGKDLSHLELLKNRLIYLSTLLHEDDETKGRLRTCLLYTSGCTCEKRNKPSSFRWAMPK